EQGRRHVAAEAEEQRMAERELAGEAEHHVPRLPRIGGVEEQREHGEQVVVDDERRDQKRNRERAQQHEPAARNAIEQPDHAAFFPSSPCGRNRSTSTRIPNANMLFADGVNRRPAMASVNPISTPPSSAPSIEPRPPVITMTKASKVSAGPSGGVTSMRTTSMAPAAPTQAAPRPNVSA